MLVDPLARNEQSPLAQRPVVVVVVVVVGVGAILHHHHLLLLLLITVVFLPSSFSSCSGGSPSFGCSHFVFFFLFLLVSFLLWFSFRLLLLLLLLCLLVAVALLLLLLLLLLLPLPAVAVQDSAARSHRQLSRAIKRFDDSLQEFLGPQIIRAFVVMRTLRVKRGSRRCESSQGLWIWCSPRHPRVRSQHRLAKALGPGGVSSLAKSSLSESQRPMR